MALASKRLKALALAFLASLLAAGLPWPARLVVALLAIATMVIGVRALAAVRRARLRGPVLAVTAGATLVAGLMAINILTALALWPLPLQAQQCSRNALTISAKNLCDAQFQQGVNDRLNQLLPGIAVSPSP